MSFEGKVAVVTGAASGIGNATAESLARQGAIVCIGDKARDNGGKAAQAIVAKGLRAEYHHLDLTQKESVAQFAGKVLDRHGHVDILINCAGWSKNMPFVQVDSDLLEMLIALNLVGPMRLSQAFLPKMIERNYGRIVNISSDAGRVGSLGETVYSAAKSGIQGFTKSLAREGAKYNVTVNCVCPGPTDTPLLAETPEKIRDGLTKVIPMRRVGKPSEIAAAILGFVGPAGDYVTGQILSASGGLTMAG